VPLREEELKAWQRLVRVLGHELNNSLAPIKSIAGSLGAMLKRGQRGPDWEDDMRSVSKSSIPGRGSEPFHAGLLRAWQNCLNPRSRRWKSLRSFRRAGTGKPAWQSTVAGAPT